MNITRHIAVKLFVTVWLVYAVTKNWDVSFMNDNALALSQALIAEQTLQIDGYVSRQNYDVALRDGKLYSGVPPGVSLLSVPFTLVLTPVWKSLPKSIVPDNQDSLYREVPLIVLHTYFLNMVAGALLCLLIFMGGGMVGYDVRRRLITAIIGAFGTILFLYASDYFQRPLAALCLFASFLILMRIKAERAESPAGAGKWVGAGLLWGMAGWFDYSAAIPMGVMGLYLLSFHRGKGVLYFALGSIPTLTVFFIYNQLAWGSPFSTPHFYLKNYPTLYPTGISDWPGLMRLDRVWGLLFSSYTGYFFFMPALAFGVLGVVRWIRDGKYRAEAVTISAIFLLMLLINIAIPSWAGGRSPGPRLMITTIPFLTLAVGEGIRGLKRPITIAVIGASIWINWLVALFPRYGERDQVLHYMEYFLKYGPTPYPARLIVWKFVLKGGTVSAPWDWLAYWMAGLVITACLIAIIWFIWRDRDEEA